MPNFLIIGAAKAGTTSLYEYLKQHPQIWMSQVKEPNFFAFEGETLNSCGPGDQDYINSFSITKIEDYLNLFQGVENQVAVGEASPLYIYNSKAAQRIQHYIPEVKLIAILRNPVERAYSQFLMFVRDGREPLPNFAEALEQEETRMRNNWEWAWQYTRIGFYHIQLQRYLDRFDRSQIRVYLFEEFSTEPADVLRDIFQFIGVDDSFMPNMSIRHNVSTIFQNTTKPRFSPEVRRRLVELYQEDIFRLQELLQRDLSQWLL